MSKLNVKVTIDNQNAKEEFMTPAIIQDNIIKYQEKDKTLVKFDYNNNLLTRENQDLRMNYCFFKGRKSIGKIYVKELNKEVEVEITTTKLTKENNNVEIGFLIEDNTFFYRIEEIK